MAMHRGTVRRLANFSFYRRLDFLLQGMANRNIRRDHGRLATRPIACQAPIHETPRMYGTTDHTGNSWFGAGACHLGLDPGLTHESLPRGVSLSTDRTVRSCNGTGT
uniref:Uncharacterized protein n=1 Tax=Solanum tuberosum TaxID=4113 RepID=M1D943_SOLTU